MEQPAVQIARKYFPNLPYSRLIQILWTITDYPYEGPKVWEDQLRHAHYVGLKQAELEYHQKVVDGTVPY